MNDVNETPLWCPYCAESITMVVDGSAGNQEYIEDCEVCCRPIVVSVSVDYEGNVVLAVKREDE